MENNTSHKQRLIDLGILRPMSMREIQSRSYILQRIEQGDEIKEKPCFCVYRTDDPHKHIIFPPDENRCEKAELICDHLYSYEAWRICTELCKRDPEQPPRPRPYLPPLGMYKICSEKEWRDWEESVNQLRMDV